MALLGGETNFVGIDIGSSGIRMVQLKHGGGKPLLVTYGEVAAPGGVTLSDSAIDREKVATLIRELAAQLKVSSREVIAGIPSAKVYAAVATVPKMNQSELAKGIKYQAERLIPMPLDKVQLAWVPIESPAEAKSMEVLIVATPLQVTEKYVDIFEKAGLEMIGLEPNAMAMGRAMVGTSDKAVMIVDIGTLMTDLCVLQAGVPRLIRAVPVGGTTFNKTVAQHLGVDEAQASQFITKFGLTQTKLEGQVYQGLRPAIDSLAGEISKSVEFFLSKHPGAQLEKIVLTGGGSVVPELPVYLANASKLPVEIGNPWANIAFPANLQNELISQAANYGAAAGLALKGEE